MDDPVSRREGRLHEIRVEKIHCFRDAHCICERVDHLEATIMLQCRDNLVTIAAALIP